MKRRTAGFTLLEILLALVLLAFVMLGVWGAMRGATRVAHSADALMAQSEAVRTVQQFLRRYVSAAQPQAFASGADGRPQAFVGDATRMQYVAPLPLQSGHAGLYAQTLELKADAAGDKTLWLAYQPFHAPDAAGTHPARHLLLAHLRAGGFEYLTAGGFRQTPKWDATWQGGTGLPAAVRIELDPAWTVRVPFPTLVIRIHTGGGSGTGVAGGLP